MFEAVLGGLNLVNSIFGDKQARSDQRQTNARQEQWNQYAHRLDVDKFNYSKFQYRDQLRREDTRLQRLVKDANEAGIGVSTALGTSGYNPISTQIPGHGTRVAGTTRQFNQTPRAMNALMSALGMQRTKLENDGLMYNNQKTFHDAEFAYYRALNEKSRWERDQINISLIPEDPNKPPPFYDLYENNTDRAKAWIAEGGIAVPTGAEMELPSSIGGYHYFKPYGANHYDSFTNFLNW